MRPSELKSLKGFVDAIREEIASFRDVVKDRATAIANQHAAGNESHRNEWEQVSHAANELSHQIHERDSAAEFGQGRRHGQNLLVQWILAIATMLAFVAAAIYAGIAARQLGEMQLDREIAAKQLTVAQNGVDTEMSHFDRTMDQILPQTAAETRAAEAAEDANDRATKFFREQQSPELSLSVSPHDFGKQDASIEVALKNSGRSGASNLSLRWFITSVGEDNIKRPRTQVHSYQSGRLAPGTPVADAWNALGDESDEEAQLMKVFDRMIDPTVPFDQQAPVLPSERVYGRVKELGQREKQTLIRMGTPAKGPNWLERAGTIYTAVGDIGPDQISNFTAQGERSKWDGSLPGDREPINSDENEAIEQGRRVLYLSCRFAYTDRYPPDATQRSPDFCFRYVPSTGRFESCVRQQN